MAQTQKVPCPGCGLPVEMPADWDGRSPDEALCCACYEKAEQKAEPDGEAEPDREAEQER